MKIYLRKTLGLFGFLLLIQRFFFSTNTEYSTPGSANAGEFFFAAIVLLFLYSSVIVFWNMLTDKITNQNRYDRLFSTAAAIGIITLIVKIPTIISLGVDGLDVSWFLVFVLVPIIGWYDKKHFGSKE